MISGPFNSLRCAPIRLLAGDVFFVFLFNELIVLFLFLSPTLRNVQRYKQVIAHDGNLFSSSVLPLVRKKRLAVNLILKLTFNAVASHYKRALF